MARSKILILGGGFGGAYTAKHLLRQGSDVSVELVSATNYFVFQPLLPEVVGGAVNALDTVTPLRMMLPGAEIRSAMVRAIDFRERWAEVIEGHVGRLDRISYDHLVLAFGQIVDLSRFPGLQEHGFTVKEAADSFALRNHVIGCLERAGSTADRAHRQQLLSFVVVGGGFSGIEVLGELHELVHRALRFYPKLEHSELRFVLVEYQNAILPEVPPDLARYAARTLQGRGVEFVLGHGIKSAAATSLELDDGTIIETRTIVATIGNGPNPLAAQLGLTLERGRIKAEADLRLPGHDNVWVIGDAAAIPLGDGTVAPPTAQAAVREAKVLAGNILDSLEQMLDLFLPRSIVRTQSTGTTASRFVRQRAGDVVIFPGQLGDGVHLVVEGAYEQILPDGEGRVFLPGDTFGDAEIAAGRPHEGLIRARENSRCFILKREEYQRIQSAMKQARERALPEGAHSYLR